MDNIPDKMTLEEFEAYPTFEWPVNKPLNLRYPSRLSKKQYSDEWDGTPKIMYLHVPKKIPKHTWGAVIKVWLGVWVAGYRVLTVVVSKK
jgi:hypothetical protein